MRRLFLLIFIGLCGGGLIAGAQENLVANGGFEEPAGKTGLPGGGWYLAPSAGEPAAKVDRTQAHQGHASVRLTSGGEEKCVLASRKFAVAPGDVIQFEAWARGSNLPAGRNHTYAGMVFRDGDGKIVARRYTASPPLGGDWQPIAGSAEAPLRATFAEMHLGYTNGPGTIWYDDASAGFAGALSLSLSREAKPWSGPQKIAVRAASRMSSEFKGSVAVEIGRETESAPVDLAAKSDGTFEIPITLKGVGQHAYTISLLDQAGQAVKVIRGKFLTAPPLTLCPPCPCYQIAGAGNGDTLIDARININPAEREGLKLSVTLRNSDGQELKSALTAISKGDWTELHMSIPLSATNLFKVQARIVEASGHEAASADSEIHVIAPGEAEVRIGPDGFLRVGGKAEFPIGLYNSSRNEELGAAGFNATHEYEISYGDASKAIDPTDTNLQGLLDKSRANGLRMMVELPRQAIEKGQWTPVRRRIETFRHHPGLLCWGSEERVARGLTSPTNIAALYALLHKLDPDHPLVLGDTRDAIEKLMTDRRDFFPDNAMDIGIWWWYPIPEKAAKGAALEGNENSGPIMEAPTWLTATHSKKPLWIAIQAYQKPTQGARFSTPEEYRCQAYSSLIYGAKGLFFYCGSGQRDYAGKPSGILNKPEAGHWDYVKQLAGELRDFSPALMAPPAGVEMALTQTNLPVIFATRKLDGAIYLMAANKSGQAQHAIWRGEFLQGKKASVLFEKHAAKVEEDSLADDFPAYGVHVYKLE
jgi:hypothetical protein